MEPARIPRPATRPAWPALVYTAAAILAYSMSLVASIIVYHVTEQQMRFRTIVGIQAAAAAAAIVLTIMTAGTRSIASVRLMEAARTLLTLAILALQPRLQSVDIAVVLSLTAGFALYQPGRTAAVASAIAIVACTGTMIAANATPTDPALAIIGHSVTVLVVACASGALILFVETRERHIQSIAEVARLRDTVTGLSQANLGYQRYASDAELRSAVEERNRITRELHDIIGYAFVNNIMMLEAALSKINKDPDLVQRLINLARSNLEEAQTRIRAALYLLRSTAPSESTIAYIDRLVQTFRIATRLSVRVDYTNCPAKLPGQLEEFVVYFIQEALVNAFKHGRATDVHVYFHAFDGQFSISVTDNGVGFGSATEGIGLTGMRERLEALGGNLEIQDLGGGVSVIAMIPFGPNAPAGHAQKPEVLP